MNQIRIGIGVDIEDVDRFKKYSERSNSLLHKIYTQKEIEYCFKKRQPDIHLAVRFAGKEAVMKALCSIGESVIHHKAIEIINNNMGVPVVRLEKTDRIDNLYTIQLSMSHCKNKVVAFVIIYYNEEDDNEK